MISWTFIRFLIVGVLNTIVGLSVIFLSKAYLGFDDILANICGYAVGLNVSFWINRSWTFQHTHSSLLASMRFLIAFVIAYSSNLTVVLLLINQFDINSYFAQTAGIFPYTLLFFFLNRYFVFADKKEKIE
jgi:putative flippase GtrA